MQGRAKCLDAYEYLLSYFSRLMFSSNNETQRTYDDTAAADDTPLKNKDIEERRGC